MVISLISHPGKVKLKGNYKLHQHDWPGNSRWTSEHPGTHLKRFFNGRILIEKKKHLQHQRDLYHNFIDFKKALDKCLA